VSSDADRGGRTVLIVAGLLAVTAVAAFLLLRTGSEPAPRQDEGRPIADLFLAQIREGQLDDAWESTTADYRSDQGRDAFRSFIAARPGLKQPAEFVRFEEVSVNDLKRSKYTYRLQTPLPSGSSEVGVLIANENGAWKVEQFVAP
jgi:hypothetical protein